MTYHVLDHFGSCVTVILPRLEDISFKKMRTTGIIPLKETGAITWVTLHSLPFRLTMLPTLGVSIAPLGSSSTSCVFG